MNADNGTPETEGLTDPESVRKDRTYSPASESETEQKQAETISDNVDSDIDPDQVEVAPGTGGPDDVGEIEVDPGDLNLPWKA
ncbi:hypothetical protein DEU34_1195 [Microbacterium sp. AG1240]|uniref:hypothetical protein n=1 Tax=Microbacterium sp. AG1240 TaxID=2183992 RepID=UPI000EAD7E8F|nr:hypothetical protein [Microbacterium sp. AG1240]RKT36674.1 hypothetical protein DEU34_1195 [Microbacterium sp. AG1240]